MADWGFQRQIDDLALGIRIARFARCITGYGLRPMTLLGYSLGAQFGYCLLNEETQLPRGLRQVEAFIPVDFGSKTDSQEMIALLEWYRGYYLEQLALGIYGESGGMREVGQFAREDSTGPSPVFPGLTNRQAALFLGSGQIWGEDLTLHYLAGECEGGFPSGFQFVTWDQWLDFLVTAAVAEPTLVGLDQVDLMTGDTTPWDDYLAEIMVPVFYIAANGGVGAYCSYMQTLIGSTDNTELIVSTNPPEGILYDFAHIDMFIGYNAQELVWQPILQWLEDHTD